MLTHELLVPLTSFVLAYLLLLGCIWKKFMEYNIVALGLCSDNDVLALSILS